MSTYTAINLVKRPTGGPIGPDLFEKVEKTIPEPADGEFLVRQTHMSLDPAMLGWMSPDTDSYVPPVELGTVMRSSGLGEVVSSRHPDFQEGDRVMGMFGWQEYALSDGSGVNRLDADLSPEAVLSVMALPGLTATKGLYDFGHPRSGETLIVTGAAGSVGSIVGQLAKAEGLNVIGVAGSDEKCDWIVNTLGFDGAINYRTDDLAARLDELAPDGIDVFFENTGGDIQPLIVERMNAHGRIVVCGMIADYTGKPKPGPNWIPVIKKRLTIQGFTMPDHLHEAPTILGKLMPHVQSGRIQYRSHTLKGLDSAMTGLNLFFTGENKGKLIVEL
ncbi:NADP-dependent oxidoreductase [Saccharospirillum salsuginis]|uniref:NADP-dependent oxidoreductase n=1 Tax=Saccharospirillum salsuginis TaxID=418750 RepID=A0A918K3Z5_9GAMM|nr:NADP-dependent oxidoreductase [Saccharospirillum salsuginis]GGX48119.1 NADP-dependent oxidoreductase [Saccharospirillum salsuginis]